MTMKIFGKMFALIVSTSLLLSLALSKKQDSEAAATRPNIVFILADDLGYGDLGCYGNTAIKTPNLDAMAANGVKFTDFYTGNTVCAPSRCALMTGQHMGHAYIRGNGEVPLRAQDLVIPERLKTVGYRTGMFGKWGLGNEGTTGAPHRKGWDEFYGIMNQRAAHFQQPDSLWTIENGKLVEIPNAGRAYANELFVQKALDFVQENGKANPFFLYLSLTIPHAELHLPQRYLDPYLTAEGESVFAPETPWPDGQHYGGQPYPKAAYAGLVSSVDDYVGQVMEKLRTLGIEENTLVMFASDNGTHIEGGRRMEDVDYLKSSGPLQGVKRDMYDGGIRTPFLVKWKGKTPGGTVSEHLGAFWDVPATLYEAAGLGPEKNADGISFLPTLLQKKQKPHEYLYWEFYERGYDQAARAGNWKAVKRGANDGKLELYDLKTDPSERRNVAAQHPDVAARMEAVLTKAHTKSDVFPLKRK